MSLKSFCRKMFVTVCFADYFVMSVPMEIFTHHSLIFDLSILVDPIRHYHENSGIDRDSHQPRGETLMKYIALIYGVEVQKTPEEMQAEMAEYYAFGQVLADRKIENTGEALHAVASATTVRVREGKTLTSDGPFAETKEALGGFYVLDCKDLDEAIELAALIPGAKTGSVELRPLVVFE